MSGVTGTNSTQRIVEFSEAAKQRAALPEDPLDSQFREVVDAVSQLPHQASLVVKEFRADAAGKARSAPCAWLRDFTAHGPLDIQSMRTTYFEGKFVTVVAYSTYGLTQEEPTDGE